MPGLAMLKHIYNLSDEALCAHWLESQFFQFFCKRLPETTPLSA
jgi:transposase, IS5 family